MLLRGMPYQADLVRHHQDGYDGGVRTLRSEVPRNPMIAVWRVRCGAVRRCAFQVPESRSPISIISRLLEWLTLCERRAWSRVEPSRLHVLHVYVCLSNGVCSRNVGQTYITSWTVDARSYARWRSELARSENPCSSPHNYRRRDTPAAQGGPCARPPVALAHIGGSEPKAHTVYVDSARARVVDRWPIEIRIVTVVC